MVKFIIGREVIYNLFPIFHKRHEGFSFYGPKNSEEGADTILIYNLLYLFIYIIINLDDFPCLV